MTQRLLLVEDEFLVALVMEEALRELDCEIVGPVGDLDEALTKATDEALDGALLDINLNGRLVYPVAERLQERGIPFAFTTGYAEPDLPLRFRAMPRLQKPADLMRLRELVLSFAGARPR